MLDCPSAATHQYHDALPLNPSSPIRRRKQEDQALSGNGYGDTYPGALSDGVQVDRPQRSGVRVVISVFRFGWTRAELVLRGADPQTPRCYATLNVYKCVGRVESTSLARGAATRKCPYRAGPKDAGCDTVKWRRQCLMMMIRKSSA
jgi:hypothetical protein